MAMHFTIQQPGLRKKIDIHNWDTRCELTLARLMSEGPKKMEEVDGNLAPNMQLPVRHQKQ